MQVMWRVLSEHLFSAKWATESGVKVLFITITMMGICTTLIGVLPTYAQIGVFAPILLVTLRIIQGWGRRGNFRCRHDAGGICTKR